MSMFPCYYVLNREDSCTPDELLDCIRPPTKRVVFQQQLVCCAILPQETPFTPLIMRA